MTSSSSVCRYRQWKQGQPRPSPFVLGCHFFRIKVPTTVGTLGGTMVGHQPFALIFLPPSKLICSPYWSFSFYFWGKVSLCNLVLPGTYCVDQSGPNFRDPPAPASWVLVSKVCDGSSGVCFHSCLPLDQMKFNMCSFHVLPGSFQNWTCGTYCPSWLFIALIKHQGQKWPGKERAYLIFTVYHHEG